MAGYHVVSGVLLMMALTSVSGLPKYYKHTLYEPGGLDHLDATGDESKWGKLVRWILTGQGSIPNKRKAALKGPILGGPPVPLPGDVVVKPNGRMKPIEAVLPDGSIKPEGADILIKPTGQIKPIGPFGPIRPDGSLKAQALVLPDGSVESPHPHPLPHPLPPPPLAPGLDTVIKPNGRVKTVGPFGPISPDGLVQPTVLVNPDGSTEQIGADVIVKPDGRIKPADALLPGPPLPPRPLGPVLPELLKRNEEIREARARRRSRNRNGRNDENNNNNNDNNNDAPSRSRPLGPFNPDRVPPSRPTPLLDHVKHHGRPDLDLVIKPNGRIKTVGPFGPIAPDGSVQPTVGVNPDGSTEQIGTDVIVKPDGRIKTVAEAIRNGHLDPVKTDGDRANDPFGPGRIRVPYGYGRLPPPLHNNNDFNERDAYPYVF